MVELVRLYSNPKAGREALLHARAKATSSRRPHERHISRQTQTRLDPHQACALAEAYTAGKTIKELAGTYGVQRVTVASLLRRQGVQRRQAGLTDEQAAEARLLYHEGWSLVRRV